MRKFFFKLHLWCSLIASPFVLIFAVTGCFMAFEPELDHMLHPGLSYVDPSDKALTLNAISNIVHKEYPADTIAAYNIATSPGISYQLYTNNRAIFIDQYSGKILGTMMGPDFWNKAQNIIHQLHLRLAFHDQHDIGGSIMSWTGLIMLFILITGLIVWWRQKRFFVRKESKSRQFWFDLHNMMGIFAILFLLISVVTGVIIGFENKTTPLLYKITGSKPSDRPEIKITPVANLTQISPDSAIHIAANALTGVIPFNINVPGPSEAYTIRCRYPEDRTPGGRSMVIIDPYSGKVFYAEGSRTAPAGTQLRTLNRAIHTGDIFGIPSKFLELLVCLALIVQIVSGVKMWLARKFRKTGAANESK